MRETRELREQDKFVESPTRSGKTAVEVVGDINAVSVPGPFAPPAGTDAFTRVVSGNNETISYRSGGITGPILKSITIYYQTPPDPDLLAGELV